MTLRLLFLYLLIAFGPLLAFSAVFAARGLLGRQTAHPRGNGHAKIERLEHTVEEARARQ